MVGKLRRLVVSFLVYLVKTQHLAVLAPKNQCFFQDVSCRGQTSNSWNFFRNGCPGAKNFKVWRLEDFSLEDLTCDFKWDWNISKRIFFSSKFEISGSPIFFIRGFYWEISPKISQRVTKKQQRTFNSCTCQISWTLPKIIVWWKKMSFLGYFHGFRMGSWLENQHWKWAFWRGMEWFYVVTVKAINISNLMTLTKGGVCVQVVQTVD